MNYVQAFINNISFPTNLDGLEQFAELFDIERILGLDYFAADKRYAEFTAPKWRKKGDIVFFMHSKTANARISALKTELISKRRDLENEYFWSLMNSLFRAKQLHKSYGGKIFAVGRVSGKLIYDNESNNNNFNHWKGRIYAPIDSIFLLQNPIDISDSNSFIKVSRQSGITPVIGEEFDRLKDIILKKNHIVEHYFENSKADPVPLKDIDDSNWIDIGYKYRRSFFLEEQFREYYVNWLLKCLGDKKTVYRECSCFKGDKPITFVDNIIVFNSKYLPVEVKLSVSAEKDILSQLRQYCNLNKVKLDKKTEVTSNIYDKNVLVIDTEKVYLYNNTTNKLCEVINLNKIKKEDDIKQLKQLLASILC